MKRIQQEMSYYKNLDAVAKAVIRILSQAVNVNTVFLASNDQTYNYILKSFNRRISLMEEGSIHPFCDVLCSLMIGRSEPLVIPNLREHPLTENHPITIQAGNGCFLSVPIYLEDRTMFGTLCAYDIKPHEFQSVEVEIMKNLGLLLTQTIMLERYLIHDPLTGLYNRDFIKNYLLHKEQPCSVLCIDLDDFQAINDTFGHEVGDQALIEVANRLVQSIPEQAVVARAGADEYLALVPHSTHEPFQREAKRIAEQILHGISSTPILIKDEQYVLTASIGISYYPEDGQDMKILLEKADTTMCVAKEKGKNKIQFYKQEMKEKRLRKRLLEFSLRNAIAHKELYVVYQPQFELANERFVGFEALLRWQHPSLGIISPMEFIPIAEETGLIRDIGYWVLQEVCEQGVRWRQQGLPPIYLSVNLSAREFEDPKLLDNIASIMQQTGYDPHWLKVEVTESLLMRNVPYTLETMQQLKQMGIHISIDDFGTGYSSLQYLVQFPIDCLKLDRSFIMNLQKDEHKMVTTAIINLAHSLHVIAIAEGIEEQEQLMFLQEQNCEWGQGFYYSRPLPVEQAEQVYQNAFLPS